MTLVTGSKQTSAEAQAVLSVLPANFLAELPEDPLPKLRRLLQYAVQLEFATIPPYLTAMYSMQDKKSYAYHLVRSVVMEEMVHLNLAANLLNAVGGSVWLVTREARTMPSPPTYPCYLFSGSDKGNGPYLQLMPASPELFRETFMKIEQPAEPYALPQDKDFSTIGQLYSMILDLFIQLGKKIEYDTQFQNDDWNFGNNGGSVIVVRDLETAKKAINEIIEQGEGADMSFTNAPDARRYRITQPWGQYTYYGPRVDGTYGPVLGTPAEMSHYFKFKAIADKTVPLPAVYPMMPNPSVDRYKNALAKDLSKLFDRCYSYLVRALQYALQGRTEQQNLFFTEVVPLMRVALPVLATQLMQTPARADRTNTSVDTTAGPSFTYLERSTDTKAPTVTNFIEKLIVQVQDGDRPGGTDTLVAALRKVLDNLPPELAKEKM
jgi:hypothetical protein